MTGNAMDWLGGALLVLMVAVFESLAYTWPFIKWCLLLWLMWKIYRELRVGIIAQHLAGILREVLQGKVGK